jgi:hypothetical protein
MSILVPIMMFGWIPIILFLFTKFPPRRAVIISFIFAWLFLPNAAYPIPGLPDYTKMSATCWGVFIGAAIFDSNRLLSFKLRLLDLPMIIWCLCPIVSSMNNDLGIYDGLASALSQTVTWGFPYIIGRLYFNDLEGVKEFAMAIFIGGIIYMPLCWYEIKMSPQLHNMLYGFTQHSFAQTYRYGGWRPMVFMQHGLAVGMWMASASLVGVYLWISNSIKKIFNIPLSVIVILLIITLVLCKSMGAVGLFFIGIFTLYTIHKIKTKLLVICLLLVPLIYIPVRATGYWDGDNLAHYVYDNFDQERALSLWTRFDNENMLSEKAMISPAFGWGGWGRSRVYDDQGNDITVTDSLWIIILGSNGFVGLGSLTISILLPCIVLMRHYKTEEWFKPDVVSATAMAVLLSLYMLDNLLNAMINPIYMVAVGGITSLIKENYERKPVLIEDAEDVWTGKIYRTRFI